MKVQNIARFCQVSILAWVFSVKVLLIWLDHQNFYDEGSRRWMVHIIHQSGMLLAWLVSRHMHNYLRRISKMVFSCFSTCKSKQSLMLNC